MLYDSSIALGHIRLAALVNCKVIVHDAPTIIFTHGYLDNANSFATLLPWLDEYQCVAVDFAGHGKSEHRSEDAHYHLSDYAYDIYQLVATLNLKRYVIVGHSLGAIVGSLFASTQPAGLCGFVAIESCGPLAQSPQTSAAQLAECFNSRAKANKAIKHPASLQAVVKARCAVSDLNPDQALQIMQRNVEEGLQGSLTWRTDKRLRTVSALRLTEEQANNILVNIMCPRLLILGEQGFEKVKAAIVERQEAFINVPTFTFEGGHHVHLDATQEVATCLNAHIAHYFIA